MEKIVCNPYLLIGLDNVTFFSLITFLSTDIIRPTSFLSHSCIIRTIFPPFFILILLILLRSCLDSLNLCHSLVWKLCFMLFWIFFPPLSRLNRSLVSHWLNAAASTYRDWKIFRYKNMADIFASAFLFLFQFVVSFLK